MADSTSPETTPIREACLEWIRNERYGETITCPECDSAAQPRSGAPYTSRQGAAMYDCPECGLTFNELTGTVFNKRQIPIETLFYMVREAPSKSAAQIAREIDESSYLVRRFLQDLEDETVIDVTALRDDFADMTLVETADDGTVPKNDEDVAVPIEARTRDQLRTLKAEYDDTYDELINRLLDGAGIAPLDPDLGVLAQGGGPRAGSGGFDDRTTIMITRGTRKRLKLWKTRQGLTYDEALQQLLTEATDEPV